MSWEELALALKSTKPGITQGKMFGMACLKRPDGKVFACLWPDRGMMIKLVDETERSNALALAGTRLGFHAFDVSRPMREWVHVPTSLDGEWFRLAELASR